MSDKARVKRRIIGCIMLGVLVGILCFGLAGGDPVSALIILGVGTGVLSWIFTAAFMLG